MKTFPDYLARKISNNIKKCDGCLCYFNTKEKLNIHQQHGCSNEATKLPTEKIKKNYFGDTLPSNILNFQNYAQCMHLPFVIYVDFDSILQP